jgi:hypothetical protein
MLEETLEELSPPPKGGNFFDSPSIKNLVSPDHDEERVELNVCKLEESDILDEVNRRHTRNINKMY